VFEFVGTLLSEHGDGAGTQRTGLLSMPPVEPVGPIATLMCPIKRSILARWAARDSFADRSLITGRRNTFSGIFDAPESIRRFPLSAWLIKTK
jgi:hypothetical protein